MQDDLRVVGREGLDRRAAKAMEKPEDPAAPPRWTGLSKACAAVAAIGGIGGVSCFVAAGATGLAETRHADTVINAGLIALVLGFVGGGKAAFDLLKPDVSKRAQPGQTLSAYLRSVRCGWWPGAAACLSWSTKDGSEARRPEIAALDLDAAAVPIRDGSDLRLFWELFLVGGRKLDVRVTKVDKTAEDRALVTAQLRVTLDLNRTRMGSRARQGGTLIRDRNVVDIVGNWSVYRRDGLWFLLEAGLPEGTRCGRQE